MYLLVRLTTLLEPFTLNICASRYPTALALPFMLTIIAPSVYALPRAITHLTSPKETLVNGTMEYRSETERVVRILIPMAHLTLQQLADLNGTLPSAQMHGRLTRPNGLTVMATVTAITAPKERPIQTVSRTTSLRRKTMIRMAIRTDGLILTM